LAQCHPGASRIACECWDRLAQSGIISGPLEHVHFVPGQETPEGKERTVEGTNYRPDARDPQNPTVLYEYLGNAWHGYPPGHRSYHGLAHHTDGEGDPVEYAALYAQTMERFQVLSELGYEIRYVWGHEYRETRRQKCPRSLSTVLHTYLPAGK
jgi:hypothetical protein